MPHEPGSVNDVAKAQMASLGLSKGDFFGYWFDFGDDWWHQIAVMDIKEKAPKGKYPKVTKRVGASPPPICRVLIEIGTVVTSYREEKGPVREDVVKEIVCLVSLHNRKFIFLQSQL